MLNIKIINGVIIVSLFLLVIAFFVNPPFAQNTTNIPNKSLTGQDLIITPLVITPTIVEKNSSKPIPCDHPYFPLVKGASFDYKLEYKTDKIVNKPLLFTNKVIEASGSSAIIETKIIGTKIISNQKISCRDSGIYGFPFLSAIMHTGAGTKEQLALAQTLEKTFNNMFLIPDYNSLIDKKSWNVPVKLENLPIPISLIFQGKSVLNQDQIISIQQTIRPTIDFLALPDLSTKVQIEAELKEGIGIISYTIEITDKKNPLTIKIDLVK